MRLLGIFSGGASYGLPIGGPAARLLSELLLNQIDHLLLTKYKFCRFADDYVIAVPDQRSAYAALVFLSEKLQNIRDCFCKDLKLVYCRRRSTGQVGH